MATHGENRWPPVGTFSGRLWGDFHGRRHARMPIVAQGLADDPLSRVLAAAAR